MFLHGCCQLLHETCIRLRWPSLLLAIGHSENSSDNSEIPTGSCSAGTDITTSAILWDSLGSGPVEQVRVTGAVSSSPTAGQETAAGEVAQGGQGTASSPQVVCFGCA